MSKISKSLLFFVVIPVTLSWVVYNFTDFGEMPYMEFIFVSIFVYFLYKTVASFSRFSDVTTTKEAIRDSFVVLYILMYVSSLIYSYNPLTGMFVFNFVDTEISVSFAKSLLMNLFPFGALGLIVFPVFAISIIIGARVLMKIRGTQARSIPTISV